MGRYRCRPHRSARCPSFSPLLNRLAHLLVLVWLPLETAAGPVKSSWDIKGKFEHKRALRHSILCPTTPHPLLPNSCLPSSPLPAPTNTKGVKYTHNLVGYDKDCFKGLGFTNCEVPPHPDIDRDYYTPGINEHNPFATGLEPGKSYCVSLAVNTLT